MFVGQHLSVVLKSIHKNNRTVTKLLKFQQIKLTYFILSERVNAFQICSTEIKNF